MNRKLRQLDAGWLDGGKEGRATGSTGRQSTCSSAVQGHLPIRSSTAPTQAATEVTFRNILITHHNRCNIGCSIFRSTFSRKLCRTFPISCILFGSISIFSTFLKYSNPCKTTGIFLKSLPAMLRRAANTCFMMTCKESKKRLSKGVMPSNLDSSGWSQAKVGRSKR